MTYAFVFNETVIAETAILPTAARRFDTGEWVLDLPFALDGVQQACGWFQVVAVERPPDTETMTQDRTLTLVDSVPVEQWTERLKTQDEIDAGIKAANEIVLLGDATANIGALLASVLELNLLTARTNADINTNPAAAIKDLARECKTVARQTIRIARLVTDTTLSVDSGS